MSLKLLAPDGHERYPTLEDDMESLLYVILYCSLLWLPHNLSKRDLALMVRMMFEDRTWLVDQYHGGEGKTANAFNRRYTKMVTFKEPLHDWLQTVMDYHSPRIHLREEYRGYWSDPDHLESFWRDFLQTRTFQPNDRVVHDHPAATGEYPPLGSSRRPYSTEVIWFGRRDENSPDGVATAAPRKRRLPSQPPIRRSKRLKELAEALASEPEPPRDPTSKASARPQRRQARQRRR